METATLRGEALSQFCSTTNHYECSDGRWLLVTVVSVDDATARVGTLGVRVAIGRVKVATRTAVFLSDENANVLDADGDPANGLTPLDIPSDIETHEAALSALGYELIGDD